MDKTEIFNKIYSFSKPTLNIIVSTIIQDVDLLNIKGEDKKKLSMDLITDFTNTLPPSDYKIALLSSIEAGVVSDMIDLIILASKKQLKLNKKSIIKMLISYLKCCINILSKK
jgi:hypothetical protein